MKKLMILALGAVLAVSLIGAFAATIAPESAAIGIIGGADGPTSIYVADKKPTMTQQRINVALQEQATVSVNASCEIDVKPDIAYINVGVTTEGADAKKAQMENAKKIADVQAAIIKAGVSEKQIQTNYLSVNPKYDYSQSTEKMVGYTVSNTLKITVYNIEKVGELVNIALASGANTLQNVVYDLKNSDEVYNKVLVQAIQNSKSKATAMASAAGKTLGPVVSLEEGANNYSPYYSDVRVNQMKAESASADAGGVGDSIKPGSITVTAYVKGVYEIK